MAGNFKLLNLIGSGTYGEAWLAKCLKNDSKCVVKVIKILKLTEKELDRSLTEVSILARCNHPNIISYLDAYVNEGCLNIAMEYADGGDLHKTIVGQKGIHFGKEVIFDWFVQICLALKYIHSSNILHRDLKSQNIFLNSRHVIKLGDFGIARILRDSDDHALTTIGTPFYLSPEICQRKPYNHKSDMWAAGCVLYEMCCLHVPFNAQNFDSLVVKILQGKCNPIPRHFGSTMDHLIHRLLNKDPDIRPAANEILSMPQLRFYSQRYEQGQGPVNHSTEERRLLNALSEADGNKNTKHDEISADKTEDNQVPRGGNPQVTSPKEKKIPADSKGTGVEFTKLSTGDGKKTLQKDKKARALSKGGHVKESSRQVSKVCTVRNRNHFGVRKMAVGKMEEKPSDVCVRRSSKEKAVKVAKEQGLRKKKLSSDKENVDPSQMSGKTYAVKNSKFRHLSHVVPLISTIVNRQRAALSADTDTADRPSSSSKMGISNADKPETSDRPPSDSKTETLEDMNTMVVHDSSSDVDDEVFQEKLSLSVELPADTADSSEQPGSRKSVGAPSICWKADTKGKQFPRRSISCDNVIKTKDDEQNIAKRALSDGNIRSRRVNEKTYLVSKLASKGADHRPDRPPSSGKRTVAVFIAKTLFTAIQDTQTTPSAAAGALYCRLVEVFGQQRAKLLVECTSRTLNQHKDFGIIHQEYTDNELVYFPLVAQYLTLQNVMD